MFEYTYRKTSESARVRVDSELEKSFQNIEFGTPRFSSPSATPRSDGGGSNGGRSRSESDNLIRVTSSFSTAMLTPLRKRVEKQMVFAGLDSTSAAGLGKFSMRRLVN